MRKFLFAAATAASLLAISPMVANAETAPSGQLIFGVDHPGDRPVADHVQFIFGGRNYCWYDGGWRGPGFYWCGFAWRRGLGWAGAAAMAGAAGARVTLWPTIVGGPSIAGGADGVIQAVRVASSEAPSAADAAG